MQKFEINNDSYSILVEVLEENIDDKKVKVNIATSYSGLTAEDFRRLADDLYDLKGVIR